MRDRQPEGELPPAGPQPQVPGDQQGGDHHQDQVAVRGRAADAGAGRAGPEPGQDALDPNQGRNSEISTTRLAPPTAWSGV
ncbi:MAG TPA: hypothetical protein VFV73_10390 [Streptosporangiaceae bacterium]|nr:hypothetical protein [Streptosporangiaceae bacterium]